MKRMWGIFVVAILALVLVPHVAELIGFWLLVVFGILGGFLFDMCEYSVIEKMKQ